MRTFPEAVLRLLDAIDSHDGSLLVLEDLHWADGETLDVVEFMADNLESVPVLCLGTLRTDHLSPANSGDSQIALTVNTYSHVLPELQLEAAARMEELDQPSLMRG